MTCQRTRCWWRQCPGCGRERRLARDGKVMCQHNRWEPALGRWCRVRAAARNPSLRTRRATPAPRPRGRRGGSDQPGRRAACGGAAGGCLMAFRKVWYLIPSCDGCGLAWSFGDPACADGIPPHFTSPAAALDQLAADYGWQVVPRRLGRPLMACRRCAAAGVIPATPGRRWLLAVAGWARRYVPFGPVRRAALGGSSGWSSGIGDRPAAARAGGPADRDRRRAVPRPVRGPRTVRTPATRTRQTRA